MPGINQVIEFAGYDYAGHCEDDRFTGCRPVSVQSLKRWRGRLLHPLFRQGTDSKHLQQFRLKMESETFIAPPHACLLNVNADFQRCEGLMLTSVNHGNAGRVPSTAVKLCA